MSFPFTSEQLRKLYVDEGKGCPEIGRLAARDAKTVFYWLRKFEIPTRPRGSDERQHFKLGQLSAHAGHKHTAEAREKVRQATLRDGRVPYLRNGKHWLAGAAPELNPRWLGGATPERQTFYRSAEWKAACCVVWRRADACCERCGLDSRTVDRKAGLFHIHHALTFQIRETRADAGNLYLLCKGCHGFVHSAANKALEFLAERMRCEAVERLAA